jgi:hypothetical protein
MIETEMATTESRITFVRFVREGWRAIYPAVVLAAFSFGLLLKEQGPLGASFHPAVLLTLPWSLLPIDVMPQPVSAFFNAFNHLPLILTAMTLNIAFIGVVQWVCSRLPED